MHFPMTGRWPGSLASNRLDDGKESTLPVFGSGGVRPREAGNLSFDVSHG